MKKDKLLEKENYIKITLWKSGPNSWQ